MLNFLTVAINVFTFANNEISLKDVSTVGIRISYSFKFRSCLVDKRLLCRDNSDAQWQKQMKQCCVFLSCSMNVGRTVYSYLVSISVGVVYSIQSRLMQSVDSKLTGMCRSNSNVYKDCWQSTQITSHNWLDFFYLRIYKRWCLTKELLHLCQSCWFLRTII